MLLKGWTVVITRAECRPEAQTVHCIARLDENVGEAIPYLNAVLGGHTYIKDPPAVTFRSQGKLISVHGDHIAINALRDAEEADKILRWLQREINEAWSRKDEITPSFQAAPRPQVIDILKLLPKTNCRKLPNGDLRAERQSEADPLCRRSRLAEKKRRCRGALQPGPAAGRFRRQ
jgi:ArsR family metal-binding transcriptional regulator